MLYKFLTFVFYNHTTFASRNKSKSEIDSCIITGVNTDHYEVCLRCVFRKPISLWHNFSMLICVWLRARFSFEGLNFVRHVATEFQLWGHYPSQNTEQRLFPLCPALPLPPYSPHTKQLLYPLPLPPATVLLSPTPPPSTPRHLLFSAITCVSTPLRSILDTTDQLRQI